MRPIGDSLRPAVFDGIPMDIIHMMIKIGLVDYQMRPEAALPQTAFPPLTTALGNSFTFIDMTRKIAFELVPAS